MQNHFRTAVLAVILTGGTMVSYATAYVMMDGSAAPATMSAPAQGTTPATAPLPADRTDISVREACAGAGNRAERARCMQAVTQPSIRVIDLAASSSGTLIR